MSAATIYSPAGYAGARLDAGARREWSADVDRSEADATSSLYRLAFAYASRPDLVPARELELLGNVRRLALCRRRLQNPGPVSEHHRG